MLNVGGDLNVGGSDTMPGVGQATFTTMAQTMVGGDLNVGNTGGGTVMVQSGATIDVSGDVSVASQANSTGTLALTDTDTSLTCNSLTVGDGGMGTMTIAQNASVTTSSDATVGDQSGSKGTLTLTAASLSVGGDFTVGGTSSGNVTIQNGSSVSVTHDLVLGDQTGGNGKLFLDDTSTLDVGHQITIGNNGTGSITAQLGAQFTAPTIDLGETLGGAGTLTVTGAGSSVTVTNEMNVGDLGMGTVSLSMGGQLVGSLWIDDNDFTAAQSGQSTVTISGGGQLQVGGETTISAAPGSIGAITVTGTDGGSTASTLYYSRALIVGQQGHANLFIKLGGQVLVSPGNTTDNGDVQLGAESGSNGTITISGAGSTLSATNLSVGGTATAAGGTGTLLVGSGGTVQVANKIQMWKAGKVDVTGGGSVMVGSGASAPSGDVQIGAGGTLGGGGTIAGDLLNIGGIIAPGDPAMLSVTGDYTQTGGILQLDIAGTDPSDYDQLDVSGELSLQTGSNLELNFIDGFAPVEGDTFDLISYGNLDPPNNAFANVEVEGLEPGFDYTLASSGGNSFALTALNNAVAVPVPEPGACAMLILVLGVLACRFRGRRRPDSAAASGEVFGINTPISQFASESRNIFLVIQGRNG
jgi:T5SS/PEP-CTERM-associated repeat protein